MNKSIATILNQKMDRKDFLKHIGAAGLVVTGMSGITKALLQHNEGASSKPTRSYSSGSYGG